MYTKIDMILRLIQFFFRDLEKLQNGIGEKVGIFIYLLSSFFYSIIISLIYGWKLTLVVLSCAPIMIVATAIVAKVIVILSPFIKTL